MSARFRLSVSQTLLFIGCSGGKTTPSKFKSISKLSILSDGFKLSLSH
jgi:hypothetical protein